MPSFDYTFIDRFIRSQTWHTSHDTDLKSFFQTIEPHVDQADFDAAELGDYIRSKFPGDGYKEHIADLVNKADIVRDFLRMTGR